MAYNLAFPLRILQFLLAIIVLALTSYVAHWYNTRTISPSPHSINFLIFTSVWTLLSVLYLGLSPSYSPRAAHKHAILAVDGLTCLFWLAGWIALAAFLAGLLFCTGHVCGAAKAAAVLGVLEWLLFVVTTTLAVLHALRTRGASGTKAAAAAGVHDGGVHTGV
ncbi:MAG: hypothetical protein FRX48_06660 [Lasallia pustulata]|uniref:MARVEL domain-containing protein n=1 Tax=Lasallia pustulata TaxID=136370 RepID=A0A5M8PMY2_9LECA|nr:MAG: hypothetical protein FRX48_06660 [Lasallia pustulata]